MKDGKRADFALVLRRARRFFCTLRYTRPCMRILIATPLSPPDTGGPSYYSAELGRALTALGHEPFLVSFRPLRSYPPLIRHLLFAWKVLQQGRNTDTIIVLDTWSVALPAVLVGTLLRKKVVVRSGGDFLWEHYVERTKSDTTLAAFYQTSPTLSLKERLVKLLVHVVVFGLPTKVVFSTLWQRDIVHKAYRLPKERTAVISNYFVKHDIVPATRPNTFLWAGRDIFLKNTNRLKTAFKQVEAQCPDMQLEVLSGIPQETLHSTLKSVRALVLPSLSEVSPNIVLEALSYGVPVVLTKETGYRDFLDGSVLFVDPLNEADIRDKLLLLCDENEYANWRKAVKTYNNTHTYEDIAREYLLLCEQS